MVNRPFGEKSQQLHNRHARSDFETKTQDVGIDREFVGKLEVVWCVSPRIFDTRFSDKTEVYGPLKDILILWGFMQDILFPYCLEEGFDLKMPFETTACLSFRLPGQAGGLSSALICHLQDLIVIELASTEWAGTIFNCQSGNEVSNSWNSAVKKMAAGNAGSEFMFSLLGTSIFCTRPLSQWCMRLPVGSKNHWSHGIRCPGWQFQPKNADANAANVTLGELEKCARGKDWMTGWELGISPAMVGWDLNEMTQLLASLVAIKQRPNNDDSAAVRLDKPR